MASALPSPRFMNFKPGDPEGPVPDTVRGDLWAFIAATSSGLDYYRHQADALAFYWLLRSRGLSDDRIILMLTDDVKNDAGNAYRGEVRDRIGGTDLRAGAKVDYSGDAVTVRNFEDVLLGYSEDGNKPVLHTSVESDVLVFVAGEGENGDVSFANSAPLTARKTGKIVSRMYELGRYRQLLFLAQLDEGADMFRFMKSPDAAGLAASSHEEAAMPACYDSTMHLWLTDRFTTSFIRAVSRSKTLSVADTYRRVYLETAGSHVELVNHANFAVSVTGISDFLNP